MSGESRLLAIYVHIPFCAKHCAYCDFNTYVEKAQSALVPQTVDALCRDIARTAQALAEDEPQITVPTVFFGGGTPTFLSGEQLARILGTVRDNFAVAPDAEITSEANPGSSDAEKFAAMRAAGFNRLSVGVQAFDDTLLAALDRFHTAGEAERALNAARAAGFANLSLDLMFGLPKQTPELWHATLERALALQTEHLSLYALTLEPGTRFERLHKGGKLPLPDEDTELAMYETSIARLTTAGYEHYEVSNFARPGFRSRHNQVYWRNEEYLGFGPGAVSYWKGRRWKRERLPARYVQKVNAGSDLAVESECLDADGALGETMMLGLRLRDGLPLQRVRDRFGVEPLDRFAPEIARLAARGLLVLENDTLRLTHAGLLLANDVLSAFLPD
ncbi:MAG TPA: radical SAM family heme chaperone HemW [Chthonomonadaceae bacterium]|nr:radical SAM family heme chaperone HemW [Chthonomonadaceae bacterium]